VTKIVSPDAMKKALPGLVPGRFLDLNIKAFDKGYDYGEEVLKTAKPVKAKKKTAAKKKTTKSKT
jgi:Pyruvate/2-oxoacid:ferredoxin oxidoreductase gamma subunit